MEERIKKLEEHIADLEERSTAMKLLFPALLASLKMQFPDFKPDLFFDAMKSFVKGNGLRTEVSEEIDAIIGSMTTLLDAANEHTQKILEQRGQQTR